MVGTGVNYIVGDNGILPDDHRGPGPGLVKRTAWDRASASVPDE